MDVSVQATIVNLLNQLKQERGLSYLFITHDLGLVERIADRVLVMYLGEIVEAGPVGDVFHQTQHPYTQALLNSIPSLDPRQRDRLQALSGEVPSALNRPHGCAFQSRCQKLGDKCQQAFPRLEQGGVHDSACFYPLLNEHHHFTTSPQEKVTV